MARRPRLVIPGLAHYVLLTGHNGGQVVLDALDHEAMVSALRDSLTDAAITIHALAILTTEVHLLVRPQAQLALARLVQTLGRRYVKAFNQRHGRSGTLWDGRYRAAAVEPGAASLAALRHIDRLAAEEQASWPALTGAVAARLAVTRQALLSVPPELWALGNTPFEREAAYQRLLAQELTAHEQLALDAAVRSGRVFGGPGFIAAMAVAHQRPLGPPRKGRPVLAR